ncbi:uncharacterized protein N7459_001953 [Penicillium hispanicum]|uniref:uncharacterized protein n=1 Tax=Penicillium hispanicum TaxID=1080232 RepID=UPI0025401FD0|nr:uncharacterized protein N7459_001953 [Penicillium hispanicum]KAJ5591584.1 hypothetical protein N7459_001953 [Penicillium hispanicum]
MRISALRPLLTASSLGLLLVGGALVESDPDRNPLTLKAADLFKMVSDDEPGSCADRPVDRLLREAGQLVDNATSVLNLFGGGGATFNQEHENLANMLYAMFGAKYSDNQDSDTLSIDDDDDRQRLRDALENFEAVQYGLKSTGSSWRLACGDGGVRRVKTLGDLGLTPANEKISDKKALPWLENKDSDWFFWPQFSTEKEGEKGVYPLDTAALAAAVDDHQRSLPSSVATPCQERGLRAITYHNASLVLLCDVTWGYMSLKRAEELSANLPEYALLDNYLPLGYILLHEAMHMFTTTVVDIQRDGKAVYRWMACLALAKDPCTKAQTIENAETYVLFSVGALLKKHNWYPQGWSENVL